MENLFDGPCGYIAAGMLVVVFLMSLSWKKEPEMSKEEQIGHAVLRLLGLISKE
jgi:hypothetical protein